jgi:hypothetical protein
MSEGWEPAAQPSAQVCNALWGNLFDWVAYLSTHVNTGFKWSQPRGDFTGTMARSASTGMYSGATNTAAASNGIPIYPTVGQTIDQIGLRASNSIGGIIGATLKLYRSIDGTATLLATATALGALGFAFTTFTATLGTPEVVLANASYYMDLACSASDGNYVFGAVGYDVAS